MMYAFSLKYKQDTGNNIQSYEIGVTRMKGKWVVDMNQHTHSEIFETFGSRGTINIPDRDYVEYIEEQLTEANRKLYNQQTDRS